MLSEIFIKNFAIIDDLRVSFSGGLTILSGETGAGKSIIINAINLLLGSRATSKLVRTGSETAEIEAIFQISPDSLTAKTMKSYDFDPDEGLLIRRIISKNDRHKNYINGRLTTIQILEEITENIASIAGQHAHQGLLREEQHLLILDQFAGLTNLRENIFQCYHEILPQVQKLNELKSLKNHQTEKISLLEFQRDEIAKEAVISAEDSKLEQEKLILKNAEIIFSAIGQSVEGLYNDKGAIVERLVDIKKLLEKPSSIDPELAPIIEKLENSIYTLEDIAFLLREHEQKIQRDENRLQFIEDRLDNLKRLKRKYGGSLDSVLLYLKNIDNELSEVENISDRIIEAEKSLYELNKKIVSLAKDLSVKRNKASEILAKKIEGELFSLKMSRTKFQVLLTANQADKKVENYLTCDGKIITETGLDKALFLIAPNVGEALKPLASIASGGELSRVILALKAILAKAESVETIVFDEVDAGIGGEVAELVGKKIVDLSQYYQIICITHLPQIAKFGDNHYKISKSVSKGRTITTITCLKEDDRIHEIARMLGGVNITQTTLDHAKELLKRN